MRVFLYAGQGSQFPGMGKDLYEEYPAFRSVIDSADFGFDLKKIMLEGPAEVLSDTRYTQPCMAAFAAGVSAILFDLGIRPDAACGLSLGEYGALYAAGVWDEKTYLELVRFRGEAMADAAKGLEVAMSAMIGTTPEQAEEACLSASDAGFVSVVNYNCPGQYVICGDEAAVTQAAAYAAEHFRAKNIRLQTSGPFHTPYLRPAGDALREKFSKTEFGEPSIPVALNTTGALYQPGDDLKKMLELQVQTPVRFEADLRALLAAGADEFLEIGPGKVLSGLLSKTARAMGVSVTSRQVTTAEDIKALSGSI